MTAVHLPRIAPATAPGGLYVRIATASGQLLDARALDSVAAAAANTDQETAERWLLEHPGDEVHVYVYDGDSGVCVSTIVVTA